jgi:uncharacterized membrane protein YkgB
MNTLIRLLNKTGLLQSDIDYHLIRASMVLIFLAFGYQKWFEYEAQVLIPYISNGPLIFWLYPVFGIRGASWFLGVSEWLFGALLFLGFWDKRSGILGAIGSTFTFVGTVSIIPFMPHGWDPAAGFPIVCVKFSKWRSFGLGLGGLAELGFLVLFEIVHVEVSVGFEPVLMSFDGQRSDKTAAGA